VPTTVEIVETLIEQSMNRDVARFRDRLRGLARLPDGDPQWGKFLDAVNRSRELRERRLKSVPPLNYPPELPVSAAREKIADAIRSSQVVVIAGETGSGKTTQLPKICLDVGRGIAGTIGHTQPRRIAARSVAARIADELGTHIGGIVGYKVRFTDQARPDSLIKLMTDGILLAETQSDPLLREYDTIIIDEAHERSLNIDFLLGYLRQLLPKRPDLKVIITSATIDPQRFADHFGPALRHQVVSSSGVGGCPMLEVSGRTYPVETRYRPIAPDEPELDENGKPLPLVLDPIEAVVSAVEEVRREDETSNEKGDILVFAASEREIREVAGALAERLPGDWEVLPLFARLSVEDQQRVFKPGGKRRVVIATNVAETSITVPNIRYVIDPGEARISRYSTRTKVQRLPIEPISQASADQRKGRCGRVGPGVCIRLYSEEDYNTRPLYTDPEILRTNLASVILQMMSLKLGDIADFPFLDPPDARQIRDGYNTLYEIGAVSDELDLTPIGKRLAKLPADPRIGRMIIAGLDEGVLDEVLVIAAGLSVQDPRDRPLELAQQADAAHAHFKDEGSDFMGMLKLWEAYMGKSRELSSSKLRKWCRDHFLSYNRLREWQETHRQLRTLAAESLAERSGIVRKRRHERGREGRHEGNRDGGREGRRDRGRDGRRQGAEGAAQPGGVSTPGQATGQPQQDNRSARRARRGRDRRPQGAEGQGAPTGGPVPEGGVALAPEGGVAGEPGVAGDASLVATGEAGVATAAVPPRTGLTPSQRRRARRRRNRGNRGGGAPAAETGSADPSNPVAAQPADLGTLDPAPPTVISSEMPDIVSPSAPAAESAAEPSPVREPTPSFEDSPATQPEPS
jgi:ATP-dependent helicase HrpA